MAAEVITAIIAASVAVILTGATYWFTKMREREAELRKEKLNHSKDFVASMTGVLPGQRTPDTARIFAQACNNLNLVAPEIVVKALQSVLDDITTSNIQRSDERHDRLTSDLFYEMRKDVGITPKDADRSLIFRLSAPSLPTNDS